MKNLTMIMREYDLGIDKTALVDMYKQATAEKAGFLMIDLEGSEDMRFRKDFDGVFDLPKDKADF